MKNIKYFEEHKVIKLSDTISDNNLSADYHVNKDKGKLPYIKKDGEYIEINPKTTSIPKNVRFLYPKSVNKYNEISKEIKKLQKDQENIISTEEKNESFVNEKYNNEKKVDDMTESELKDENEKYIKLQNSHKLTPHDERRWKKISKKLNEE